MDSILFVFVGAMCLMLGVKVFSSEEQNKVFNKRNLPLTDVKKYNQLCGALVIGFGVVAEITIFFMVCTEGLISTLCTLGIIAEAILAVFIYNIIERKMIRKK